jgi:hypothetical protein
MKQTDKIVQSVIEKFAQRSAQGVAKYGTTLADNNTDDFLTHLQEELMDAVLYIEKLKQPIKKNENVRLFTHYDYWVTILKYWEEEMEIAKIGSEYYGLCNVRVGILRDIFKCIEPIK